MSRCFLPGVLRQIAEVAGEDAALAIAAARGGTQVYFPPRPNARHWLCKLIGRERAEVVCDQLTCGVGPLRLDLPLGPTGHRMSGAAKVDALLAQNLSESQIARMTGYTIRGVRMRRAKLGKSADSRQLSLI